jgi:hypothetical protein
MPYGIIASDSITDSSGGVLAPSSSVFRNRILNGAMQIDQRNAGASVTINSTANTYTVDRWAAAGQNTDGVYTAQRSTTAPSGFTNSLLATVTTADASIGSTQSYLITQFIEGLNASDLAWGTASAATVTLSFWVRSSLTGTFGGSLQNSANDRSYPFSFTINSANTWEKETITIAGDTTGTWLTDTGRGINVRFSLGAGSSNKTTAGAWAAGNYFAPTGSVDPISTLSSTFYITGVQLEKGSTATSFDYRDYGRELMMCQRYYQRSSASSVYSNLANIGTAISTTQVYLTMPILVSMRSAPSITSSSTLLSADGVNTSTVVTGLAIGSSTFSPTEDVITLVATVASGLTQYRPYYLHSNNNSSGAIQLSSEL